MKKDWEIKRLGDYCKIRTGKLDANAACENGRYPFFTCSVTPLKINSYSFDCECVLVAGNGDLNVKYYEGKFDAYQRTYIIESVDKTILDVHYLYSFLSIYIDELRKQSIGAIIKYIKLGNLTEAPIPIPPLEEQKRIVKILDEKFSQLETIKTNAQTNLQNAKDLFQSQLTKAFSNTTWEKAKLENIALDFSRGKSKHRPRNDKCLFGGDYPFIQTGDIRNADKYVTDYSETYNETGLAQSKLWPAGTLCITIAANIAETAILSFPCCFPDSVIGFIPNEKLTTVDFVYYLIQFFKSELQNLSKGAAQDNLNLAKFENMNFPLPPLSVQKHIVKELDTLSEKVRQLQEIYTKQIANCAELKQSYLQKAFEGELSN